MDLPQTLLEPILTRYAGLNGIKIRRDTQFVSFVEDAATGAITTTLLDKLSDQTFQVQSKYLFAADGARSQIVSQLGIPMLRRPGGGFAVNILLDADLSHIMENRTGNLHWVLTPELESHDHAVIACMRMVKPWHEWLCITFPAPGAERTVLEPDEYLPRVREVIGDDSIPVKILGVSTWLINEIAAEEYRRGNVYGQSSICIQAKEY